MISFQSIFCGVGQKLSPRESSDSSASARSTVERLITVSVSKFFGLFCLRLLRLLLLLLLFSVSCSSGLLSSLCPLGVSSFISVSLLLLLWLRLLVVGLCREVSLLLLLFVLWSMSCSSLLVSFSFLVAVVYI